MSNYALLFAPADVSHDMTDMQSLYRRCESVRQRFDAISHVSGRPVDELLLIKQPAVAISRMELISLGLAAGMLGISDEIQREHGDPVCAGGVSLGELVALAASGSISLQDLVEIIKLRQDLPQDLSHEEAVGFLVLPPEQILPTIQAPISSQLQSIMDRSKTAQRALLCCPGRKNLWRILQRVVRGRLKFFPNLCVRQRIIILIDGGYATTSTRSLGSTTSKPQIPHCLVPRQ